MDHHNIVLHYIYSSRNRQRGRTNVPLLQAILMAMMAVRQCDTERISRCSMTRASPKATGRRHRAVVRATINTTMMKYVPTFLAISMAIAMRRYYTARIAQWRRFIAFINATKHHHWVSTRSDIAQSNTPMLIVLDISSGKRAPVDMLAPNNNRGMTYQTDKKNQNKLVEYSVGVVKLAHYCYITHFL